MPTSFFPPAHDPRVYEFWKICLYQTDQIFEEIIVGFVSKMCGNENYQLICDTARPWSSCVVFKHTYEFRGKMALWSFPNPWAG